MRSPRVRPGFTLVELLVVIAIIAVLMALLLVAIQMVRESANRSQCANNLKQIALAAHSYHTARQQFPPGYSSSTGAGVLMYLLPYVEQQSLYEQIPTSLVAGTGGPWNSQLNGLPVNPATASIGTYKCPSAFERLVAANGTVQSQTYQFAAATDGIPPTPGSPGYWQTLPNTTTTTFSTINYNALTANAGSDANFAAILANHNADLAALFASGQTNPNLYDASVALANSLSASTGGAPGAIASATVVNGGNVSGGYAVGDILTVAGGQGTPAQLKVTTVNGGAVTGVQINGTNSGVYTTQPANPVSVTGGGGTGATFNLTWPAAGSITSASVVFGGGHQVGDVLTFTGGTTPITAKVTSVSNAISTVAVNTAGIYLTKPTNPVTVTGLSPTGAIGATVNLTFSASSPYSVINAAPQAGAGGTNYQVGDIVTVQGGTLASNAAASAARLVVTSIGAGGSISGLGVQIGGAYTTKPTSPASLSWGSGDAVQFNLTFGGNGPYTVAGATIAQGGAGMDYCYGSGYSVGDILAVKGGTSSPNSAAATLKVTAVSPSGAISGLAVVNGGALLDGATQTAWLQSTSSGYGLTASANFIYSATGLAPNTGIVLGSAGYSVNDVLTLNQGSGTTTVAPGGTATTLKVTSIGTGGAITGAQVVNPGSYINLGIYPFTVTGGTGANAKFEINWTVSSIASVGNAGKAGYGGGNAPYIVGGTYTLPGQIECTQVNVTTGVLVGITVTNYVANATNGGGNYTVNPLSPARLGTWNQTTNATAPDAYGATVNLGYSNNYITGAGVNGGGGGASGGYKVNDLLTVVGGSGAPAGVLKVSSVNNGFVLGVSVNAGGYYPTAPGTPLGVTGGSGSGATFNLNINPLNYAPTPVTKTVPGNATPGGLLGTPTNVVVAATQYAASSNNSGFYAVQFNTPFTLTYGPYTTNANPPANPVAGQVWTTETVTLLQNVTSGSSVNVPSAGSTLSNGWAQPSPNVTNYYNAFWTSQNSPVYSVTTTTSSSVWVAPVQGTPGTPGTPASYAFELIGPGDPTLGATNYLANAGMYYFKDDVNNPGNANYSIGPYYADSAVRIMQITDGTSTTIAFGEALGGKDNGQAPDYLLTWMGTGVMTSYWDCQTPSQWFMFSSMHPGVVNFAFCDGSVRPITKIAAVPTDTNATAPGNLNTPRWIAFQQLSGIADGGMPNFGLLGNP